MRIDAIAEDLWVLRYPLRLLGLPIGRTVTLIRLNGGRLVIHSTAPFAKEDVAEIRALGEPAWLMDVSRFHDSFAKEGRAAFPAAMYLVPEGFPHAKALKAESLEHIPAAWNGELKMLEIAGMPNVREHAILHLSSRTLIAADLMFNFDANASPLTKFIARRVLRLKNAVGMSPFFRLMIRDRAAFDRSMREIFSWDFDRVIVAHGQMIETNGKAVLEEIVR